MHDSANAGRRSIAILVQGGQVTLHQSNPAEGFRGAVSQTVPLRKARPAIKARTGSQFPNGTPRGNCDPEFELKTGCGFPNRPLAETTSRNPHSNWDTVSQASLFRKLHPTLKDKTGMRFPRQEVRQCCATTGERSPLAWGRKEMRPAFARVPVEGRIHVLPKLRIENRGRGQVLPRVRRARRRRI